MPGDLRQDGVPGHRWRQAVMMVPADSQWWGRHGGRSTDGAPEDLDALGFEQDAMDWQVSRLSSGESSACPAAVSVAH